MVLNFLKTSVTNKVLKVVCRSRSDSHCECNQSEFRHVAVHTNNTNRALLAKTQLPSLFRTYMHMLYDYEYDAVCYHALSTHMPSFTMLNFRGAWGGGGGGVCTHPLSHYAAFLFCLGVCVCVCVLGGGGGGWS